MKTASFHSRMARMALLLGVVALLSACATTPTPIRQNEYLAFRESRPRSILVLPPINHSPETNASLSLLSSTTRPLAEAGYYVIPVTLSEETFRQNGVTVPEEAQGIARIRLREIFGADAALHIVVERYGASYRLIESVVEAVASARLVDLRSGQELWSGRVTVVESSNQGGSNNGLVGMLLNAALSQIVNHISDRSYLMGRAASSRLLSAGRPEGILYGPYHPRYESD
ncbi:MAG: DUF799 domain-containing protein [Zoogloeaceae bacterium]|jgi:hypothetical protein|nr:DUF799 domain-containing protein [Zoogloeaceae bacterium]